MSVDVAWLGPDGLAGARQASAWQGTAVTDGWGSLALGSPRRGVVGQQWQRMARRPVARLVSARYGSHGTVSPGLATLGAAGFGTPATDRLGLAPVGIAGLGMARHGSSGVPRHAMALRGRVRQQRLGVSPVGTPRLGLARQQRLAGCARAWQELGTAATASRPRRGPSRLGAVTHGSSGDARRGTAGLGPAGQPVAWRGRNIVHPRGSSAGGAQARRTCQTGE